MAKQKNTELSFLYMDEKYVEKKEKNQNKGNGTKPRNKKKNVGADALKCAPNNESFNFENEIVIGVTKLPDENKKTNNKSNKSAKSKNTRSSNYSKEKMQNGKKNNKRVNKKQIEEVNKKRKKQENVRTRKKSETKNSARESEKKNKSKIIKGIVKWAFLLGALVASFVFFMMSPLFDLATVQVENNNKISSDTIISLSGLTIRRKYI